MFLAHQIQRDGLAVTPLHPDFEVSPSARPPSLAVPASPASAHPRALGKVGRQVYQRWRGWRRRRCPTRQEDQEQAWKGKGGRLRERCERSVEGRQARSGFEREHLRASTRSSVLLADRTMYLTAARSRKSDGPGCGPTSQHAGGPASLGQGCQEWRHRPRSVLLSACLCLAAF